MRKVMKAIAAIMLAVAVVIIAGCNKQENNNVKVMTNAPQDITATTVTIRGEVEVVAEGISLTDMGVCWGTAKNPTVSNNHLSGMNRGESFTCTITGLESNTKYHVRVYATDGTGFYYGSDQSFTTLESGGGNSNNGALNGCFTINESGNQVHFSQGNLQYQASTNTWRFAERQWDYVGAQHPDSGEPGGTVCGSDNENISQGYNGWIDLFCWGTSGNNHGAVCYQPWSTSDQESDYFAYGSYKNNLYDHTGVADWGCNPIYNGGNTVGLWRTLTIGEWRYIFDKRATTSGVRWVGGCVNGTNGILLLPDNWTKSIYHLNDDFNNNISAADWTNILEPNGVVFLPNAGSRKGNSVYISELSISSIKYWSSSHWDYYSDGLRSGACYMLPRYSDDGKGQRNWGYPVRLVCPVE